MKTSVIIPTYNAAGYFYDLMTALKGQKPALNEIVVVDSSSADGTASIAADLGAMVRTIPQAEFHHARTRNLAAQHSDGEILVFLTQDALPETPDCIAKLIEPIRQGMAAASFARQIPRPGASPLERFAKATNYPETSRLVSEADTPELGIRSFFFSNSCSAIDRETFEAMGGFPAHTIMNEDMLLAANLIHSGHKIAYVAQARVVHSHDYGLWQTFKRYFDIGAVFYQATDQFAAYPAVGEGLRYTGNLLRHLVETRRYGWLPLAGLESAAKYLGQFLGRRYRHLPKRVVKRFSLHSHYWQ